MRAGKHLNERQQHQHQQEQPRQAASPPSPPEVGHTGTSMFKRSIKAATRKLCVVRGLRGMIDDDEADDDSDDDEAFGGNDGDDDDDDGRRAVDYVDRFLHDDEGESRVVPLLDKLSPLDSFSRRGKTMGQHQQQQHHHHHGRFGMHRHSGGGGRADGGADSDGADADGGSVVVARRRRPSVKPRWIGRGEGTSGDEDSCNTDNSMDGEGQQQQSVSGISPEQRDQLRPRFVHRCERHTVEDCGQYTVCCNVA